MEKNTTVVDGKDMVKFLFGFTKPNKESDLEKSEVMEEILGIGNVPMPRLFENHRHLRDHH